MENSEAFTIEMRRFHVETYFKIPLRPTTGKPAVSQRQYVAQIGIDQSTFTKWMSHLRKKRISSRSQNLL